MKLQKHRLLFLVISLFTVYNIEAQVTIGSDNEPNTGALLDVKEFTSDDPITAKRGIGVPRVNLTDLTQLYPMFENDNDYINNTGGKRDSENLKHTGLVVYNLRGSVPARASYEDGLYLWDGERWLRIYTDQPNKTQEFFYMPSIEIDLSAPNSIDLYQRYLDQFSGPTLSSHPIEAPAIHYYQREDLYYYVTEHGENLFQSTSLSQGGVFTYTPNSNLPDDICCSYINIVFVVK